MNDIAQEPSSESPYVGHWVVFRFGDSGEYPLSSHRVLNSPVVIRMRRVRLEIAW